MDPWIAFVVMFQYHSRDIASDDFLSIEGKAIRLPKGYLQDWDFYNVWKRSQVFSA